ncbi:RdgB/HAM1 family non-canonical purine NTP pyrophosphatase [Luteibacter aegosomaticola]|jgi:XTP/dITP diphosphohydrolase|uniref:RdgB/HAM1 family non-canonical purine NTP pyrophosphatase n=1 Tax=Luteibacter aegosomaticola TaxID=2911538 RepID=UPI001FFBE8CF|nr:RdgB/HAM1 family non-canonical purine NTP pyrophosphatase [Luteibacter aegosomaticola]UPG89641.1 RdgB/HAM1 family non-canonical purine NTP pyrophosphatase [Luteibacter aegosomaticola]
MRIVLASGNAGKVVELEQLLAGTGVELVPQTALGVSDADETGLTFVENALIKARHAARATGLPALADDSGICVDALDGAPGLYAARYSGVHGDSAANNAKLLRELAGVPMDKRGAYFIAVLVLLRHAEDPAPLIAEARWHGTILEAPRGEGGFGYDPLFLPHGSDLGAAEIEPALKNRLSHRGQALEILKARFAELA